MTSKKCRVAVIYGGKSGEHEVSLRSAASVIQALDPNKFEVVPIGVTKRGEWLLNQLPDALPNPNAPLLLQTKSSEFVDVPQVSANDNGQMEIDVYFPVVHGPLYEDGTLQGLLALADKPFVGAGVLSSAVCMDKVIAKQLVALAGIPVVPYVVVMAHEWHTRCDDMVARIQQELKYPIFIKPATLGSSVGTHKVNNEKELREKLPDVFRYDPKALIEKAINAREIELSVLENSEWGQPPLVSVAGEIRVNKTKHDFYSYDAKYCDESAAELLIPAEISAEQMAQAQQIARDAFVALQCEGMLRVDLFLDADTQQFYFNEANSLPGFTSISMYPKLWEASGLAYRELLTKLIELAMSRYERGQQIQRDWLNGN